MLNGKEIVEGYIRLLKELVEAKLERNFYLNQVNKLLTLLLRVKKCYPHIYDECFTREDLEECCRLYKEGE